MAVEIDIEGQRVVISDVATEATLQKLVDKMGGAESPFGQETVKAGKEFVKQQKESVTTGKKTTIQLKGLANQAGDAASELDRAAEASRGLRDKFTGLFTKVADTSKDVIRFGASVQGQGLNLHKLGSGIEQLGDSVPGLLGAFAAVGGALGGAMVAHTANLMDTFQGLSTTGAMFTNDLFELENVAARSYLSLDEMTGMIRENSEALATFGGSAKLGAKRFAELNLGLQQTYRTELRQLGYGAKESADMLASFVAVNARNAHFSTMSTQQQTAAAAGFAKEMNLMASLTGQDRKQLADKLAQDKRRSDVELKLSRMSGEQQTKARQAFQALEAQFGANSPVLEAFRAKFLGQDVVIGNPAANMLLSGSEPIGVALNSVADGLNNGSMTIKGMFETLSKAAKDQIASGRSMEALAPYSDFAKTMTDISEGSLALAKRHQEVVTKFNGDYAKFFEAQETSLNKTGKGVIELGMVVEDAGKVVRTTMNDMTKTVSTELVGAVNKIKEGIITVLDEKDPVGLLAVQTSAVSATGGLKGFAEALKLYAGKIAEKAGTTLDDIAKAGAVTATATAPAGSKAATGLAAASKTLGSFMGKLPYIGALITGTVTAAETGNITEGIGAGGGSLGGGAAGAAIGTALLPGIGTVLGGILGSFIGESIGQGITSGGERFGTLGKLKDIFGFADGGIIKQPTLAMLGEGGTDEAVVNLGPNGKIGVDGIDTAPLSAATNAMQRSIDANAQVVGYSAQMLIEMKKFNANMDRLRTTMQ